MGPALNVDRISKALMTTMHFNVVHKWSGARIEDVRPRRAALEWYEEKIKNGWNSNSVFHIDLSIDIFLWKYEGTKYKEITGTATVKTPL